MNKKPTVRLSASLVAFGTATLLAAGLLSTSAASAADSDLVKREEDRVDVVLVDDRDDDDTNDETGTGQTNTNSGTGNSNDATGSKVTDVSQDKDLSNGDKTKDWTQDGAGDLKRDWSANATNDRSRNDTRR